MNGAITYDSLNTEERKLAERFYGQGDAFIANMSRLKKNGIKNETISIFGSTYVQQEAAEGPLGGFAKRTPNGFEAHATTTYDLFDVRMKGLFLGRPRAGFPKEYCHSLGSPIDLYMVKPGYRLMGA